MSAKNYLRIFILLNIVIGMGLLVFMRGSLIEGIQKTIQQTVNGIQSTEFIKYSSQSSVSHPQTKSKPVVNTSGKPLNKEGKPKSLTSESSHQNAKQTTTAKTPVNKHENNTKIEHKIISFVDFPSWLGSQFSFSVCQEPRCDRKDGMGHFYSSDAVILYFVRSRRTKAPKRGKPGQIWAVTGWESPVHCATSLFSGSTWRNQINYTISYHTDSDIVAPYGVVSKIEKPFLRNYTEIMAKKKNLVAWVTRNCKTTSKRMAYMQELKKEINVDLYGGCGKRISQKGEGIFKFINETYKFYLGFENSFCEDYITEKFFYRMNMDVIIIVRGAGNYSRYYPKNSYIDTRDFKTIKDLGKYLHYLDKNDTAYVEYLMAKENFKSNGVGENMGRGFCKLCEMIWKKPLVQKIYHNFHEWWSAGKCNTNPKDIR